MHGDQLRRHGTTVALLLPGLFDTILGAVGVGTAEGVR